MPKSAFTDAHTIVVETLIRLRQEAGVSQMQLAARLGKNQQWVSFAERGGRRIDVVEVYAICRALGADPLAVLTDITAKFVDPVVI